MSCTHIIQDDHRSPPREVTYSNMGDDFCPCHDDVEPDYRVCKTCGESFVLEHDQDDMCPDCVDNIEQWEAQDRRDWALRFR